MTSEQPPKDADNGRLAISQRALAAIAGFGLLVAGSIAVFYGHYGAGTLAMEGVGALLVVVGITGASIASFKVGDNELVLTKVKQAQQAYSEGDDAAAEQIVRQLAQATTPATALVPAALERSTYEGTVMSILQSALPEGWSLNRDVSTSEYRFDALISSPEGRHIAVEVFVSRSFTGGQLLSAVINTRRHHILGIDAVLVIAASADAPGFRRLDRDLASLDLPFQVVAWHPDQSSETLTAAVNDLKTKVSPAQPRPHQNPN